MVCNAANEGSYEFSLGLNRSLGGFAARSGLSGFLFGATLVGEVSNGSCNEDC
jgi:hypothetical protein